MTRADTASVFVVTLWLPYLALNTVFLGGGLAYALGLAIAAVSSSALLLAGMTREGLPPTHSRSTSSCSPCSSVSPDT